MTQLLPPSHRWLTQTLVAAVWYGLWLVSALLSGCGGGEEPAVPAVNESRSPRHFTRMGQFVAGSYLDYEVTVSGSTVQVRHKAAGTSQSLSTESGRLRFTDYVVDFDAAGASGQVLRLYQAALGRVPDAAGLGFHVQAMEGSGASLAGIAANFLRSPEFQARYGALGTTDFVKQLYANVLGRAPDAEGLAYHVGNLSSTRLSREQVLVGFSESPENKVRTAALVQNGVAFKPWIEQGADCAATDGVCLPVGWKVLFDAQVSAAARAEYLQMLLQADTVLRGLFAQSVSEMTQFAYADQAALGEVYLRLWPSDTQAHTASLLEHGSWISNLQGFKHMLNPVWLGATPLQRLDLWVAHEVGHLFHNTLVKGRTYEGRDYPVWLAEGFATYVGHAAAAAYGGSTLAASRLSDHAASTPVASLKSIEQRAAISAAGYGGYALGFLAVDYLARTSSMGPASLAQLWSLIGQGLSWEQAFAQVYGRPVEAFYAEFEAWRALQVAPVEVAPVDVGSGDVGPVQVARVQVVPMQGLPAIQGVVTDTLGRPVSGYNIYACIYSGGVSGTCQGVVSAVTDASGVFTLRVQANETYFLPINNRLTGNAGFLGFYSTASASGITTNGSAVTPVVVPPTG